MLLTNHAQKLYRGIEALGGGVIREQGQNLVQLQLCQ